MFDFDIKVDFDPVTVQQRTIDKCKNALLEIMTKIQEYAKHYAPVKTGHLRDSIFVYPAKPATKIIVADGVKYGIYQEYGTWKMRAHPFMRPARWKAMIMDAPRIFKKYGLR